MDIRYASRIFVFVLISTHSALGLRITNVILPSPMVAGGSGWLDCQWEGEGDIYSLKWYMGLQEFYRWMPGEKTPVKTFKVEGDALKLDLKASRRGRVKVDDVKLRAAGLFRCEVSGEAPYFQTSSEVATLTVVGLPDGPPVITGVQEQYQLHDQVQLACLSFNARPPPRLSFYVNDRPADTSWLQHPREEEGEGDGDGDAATGLATARLGLHFQLLQRHFQRGAVRVRCVADILNVYKDTAEVVLRSDQPYHASIMEGRASPAPGAVAASCPVVVLLLLAMLLG